MSPATKVPPTYEEAQVRRWMAEGRALTGPEVSEELGVHRGYLHKTIQAMEQEGCRFDSTAESMTDGRGRTKRWKLAEGSPLPSIPDNPQRRARRAKRTAKKRDVSAPGDNVRPSTRRKRQVPVPALNSELTVTMLAVKEGGAVHMMLRAEDGQSWGVVVESATGP